MLISRLNRDMQNISCLTIYILECSSGNENRTKNSNTFPCTFSMPWSTFRLSTWMCFFSYISNWIWKFEHIWIKSHSTDFRMYLSTQLFNSISLLLLHYVSDRLNAILYIVQPCQCCIFIKNTIMIAANSSLSSHVSNSPSVHVFKVHISRYHSERSLNFHVCDLNMSFFVCKFCIFHVFCPMCVCIFVFTLIISVCFDSLITLTNWHYLPIVYDTLPTSVRNGDIFSVPTPTAPGRHWLRIRSSSHPIRIGPVGDAALSQSFENFQIQFFFSSIFWFPANWRRGFQDRVGRYRNSELWYGVG